jgi:hypothetical protein
MCARRLATHRTHTDRYSRVLTCRVLADTHTDTEHTQSAHTKHTTLTPHTNTHACAFSVCRLPHPLDGVGVRRGVAVLLRNVLRRHAAHRIGRCVSPRLARARPQARAVPSVVLDAYGRTGDEQRAHRVRMIPSGCFMECGPPAVRRRFGTRRRTPPPANANAVRCSGAWRDHPCLSCALTSAPSHARNETV